MRNTSNNKFSQYSKSPQSITMANFNSPQTSPLVTADDFRSEFTQRKAIETVLSNTKQNNSQSNFHTNPQSP